MLYTALNEIKNEYLKKVHEALKNAPILTAELLLELSITLFNELKIKDISNSEYKENDMLLYQYGTYNWGNELGTHFSLDITRQFIAPGQDEPYQLSLSLIYEPERFKDIGAYNCWSDTFIDVNEFAKAVIATDGFRAAANNTPKTYQIRFEQC